MLTELVALAHIYAFASYTVGWFLVRAEGRRLYGSMWYNPSKLATDWLLSPVVVPFRLVVFVVTRGLGER